MKELKRLGLVIFSAVFLVGLYMLCSQGAQRVLDTYSDKITPSLVGKVPTGSTATAAMADVMIEDKIDQLVRQGLSSHVTIGAVGDIYFSASQMEYAYSSESGTFDFTDSLKYIQGDLATADYTLGNFQATMAGADGGNTSELYGYCTDYGLYNVPETAAVNLKAAGISMLNLATSHALDSWTAGLSSSMDFTTAAGMDYIGTRHESTEDNYTIKDINGVSVGFIGYTDSTNGFSTDEGYEYMINKINGYDSDSSIVTSMCDTISAMKSAKGAELVFVMFNFGESNDSPTSAQTALFNQIFEAGADVILGNGSSVVRPVEVRQITDAQGETRQGILMYSMGRFLSDAQYDDYQTDTDMGVILQVQAYKAFGSGTVIKGFTLTPTYQNWVSGEIATLPLCQVHDQTSPYQDILSDTSTERINTLYDTVAERLFGESNLNYTYDNYRYQVILTQ